MTSETCRITRFRCDWRSGLKAVAVAIVAVMLVDNRPESIAADDPNEAVSGTVVSPDGNPLPGIKVRVFSNLTFPDPQPPVFNDRTTDEQGRFSIELSKNANSVLWIIPKDFAVVEKFLAKKRGDLGIIKLMEGVRISGQVKSVEGNSLKGVAVKIEYSGSREASRIGINTNLRRGAISDADGHFEFDPLEPGDYKIAPSETLEDPLKRDPVHYEIPGVFTQKKITVKDESGAFDVSIQAIPHVVISGQCYDSHGDKGAWTGIRVFGQIDGSRWNTTMQHPDPNGAFSILVPHGLQNVRVQGGSIENYALRYRIGKEGPLQNRTVEGIELGTLNDDVSDFDVIRYKSPTVLVSAVDEEQNSVPGFQVIATYSWGKQRIPVNGGLRSDVGFFKQSDGRQRSRQILPDEELTFKVTASGFEPAEKMLKFAEGENQDLIITMKKRPSGNSAADRESK